MQSLLLVVLRMLSWKLHGLSAPRCFHLVAWVLRAVRCIQKAVSSCIECPGPAAKSLAYIGCTCFVWADHKANGEEDSWGTSGYSNSQAATAAAPSRSAARDRRSPGTR